MKVTKYVICTKDKVPAVSGGGRRGDCWLVGLSYAQMYHKESAARKRCKLWSLRDKKEYVVRAVHISLGEIVE